MAMEMRGSLNLSKYYTKSNQPKFYGKGLINGVEYEIKGWEKVRADTGEVWISLLFEDPADKVKRLEDEFAPAPKEKTLVAKEPISYKHVNIDDIDDIPF